MAEYLLLAALVAEALREEQRLEVTAVVGDREALRTPAVREALAVLTGAPAEPTANAAAMLDVVHLRKVYAQRRRQTVAVDDLHFSVADKEFLAIVGPSGCGKTTMLRMLAGLLPPTSGAVYLHGQKVTEPPREMVLVFQDYGRSLCHWRTVGRNVGFALEHSRLGASEREARVAQALEVVGLAEFRDHYPWELSGGMQQRLQIARALAYGPRILLMDEPFGSLDALTRAELEDELLDIWTNQPKTVLFVTHDIEEAVYLADRVLILSARPSQVVEQLRVDLPRPRDQITTRSLERFVEYRNHIYTRIRRETAAPAIVAAPSHG
jgi:NitT/TauT family transport system ATP-binding protein